jgi:hypothetical protein
MLDTYRNTFIHASADCKATTGVPPKERADKKSIANLEFEMISEHPYKLTQEEVQFAVHLAHKGIPKDQEERARKEYFSVPHACLRASPLAKTYGWGFHFNQEGKVALVALGSPEYEKLAADQNLQQLTGMRSKRS